MPRATKKAAIQALVRERKWDRVGKPEWQELREAFSESTIRTALSEVGMPVEQPFAGVGTKTLEDLESSLIAMADTYASEPESRRECRGQVIAAKDRARFALQNARAAPEKRALKAEMVEWMLVWLGDPALFATWAALRKRAGLLQFQ